MKTKAFKLVCVVVAVSLLTSCAAGTTEYAQNEAGFFSGIWHGWIAPLAIFWHLIVDDSVRIYETNNRGILYDIGYYVAIISGFGSLSLTRKAKKRSKD